MKGLFIYYKQINSLNLTGVDKKVVSQLESFNENGLNCSLQINEYDLSIKTQILSLLPFTNAYPKWSFKEDYSQYDYIYLRRPFSFNSGFIRFLKHVKKNNPKIKIVLELPTYPYTGEYFVKWKYLPHYLKDKWNQRFLKKYVDRIAIQNKNILEIYGIKTVRFVNGYNYSETKIRPYTKQKNTINMIAVATLHPWQGYERIINGLKSFYDSDNSYKFNIYIVGDGTEFNYYENLINENNLSDSIHMVGFKNTENITPYYENCDFGLESFGRYKSNNMMSTSLKSREYLAKGLPIISGCPIDILDEDFQYVLYFSNNNETVDYTEIVKFYQKIYESSDYNNIFKEIREYGVKTSSNKNSMKNVIEYIKS